MRHVPTRAVANEQDFTPDESDRSDGFVWAAAPLVFIQPNAVINGGDAPPDATFVFAPSTAEQSYFVADRQEHFAPLEEAGVAPANGDTDAGSISFTFAEADGRPVDYFLFHSSQPADALTEGTTALVPASSSEPLTFVGVAAPAASSGLSTFVAHSDFGVSAPAVALPSQEAAGYQTPQTASDVSPAIGTSAQAAAASVASAMPGPEFANAESSVIESSAPVITESGIGGGGATAAQVQKALDESGLSVNGTGIKVGVLSDSFNDLGGAAADEADGALPSAANVQVLKDMPSGGTDEGRAMMQIIHDIAPGASLAFYTAFEGEQDFANGILALAASGAKVIVDDVSYFDEPFFQNGIVAQAIQTVEAEGVTYVTAAGNDASNGYQAAWTPTSGSFDGVGLTDAESFSGSIVQTVTVGANSNYDVPLLLEWNQAYGAATSDLEVLVFSNGRLVQSATNATYGETGNPWVYVDLTGGATYQIAVENLSGSNPGLIKEIAEGDGLPVTIAGANVGTVYGHAMTPGVISAGAVSANYTPAFGVNPALSESFSSSGAGTELLFANNGTALSSPDVISPVAVSGIDDIATSVPGGLSDFYGTSASSASLAGVAALILSANPNLTPAAVEQIMEETALPMANAAISGAGLVQVNLAVAAAAASFVVAGTSTEAIQGGAAISLLTGAPAITDPASTTLTSATIKIANSSGAAVAGDELYINGIQSGSVGSGVTASWNATTSTLTLSGTASLAVYDTLLSEASYKDTGTDTSSGSHPVRTVSWSVNDGTSSYSATSQVTIDRAPAAGGDAVAVVAGTTVTKSAGTGVLANDTDLDRDTLTVTGVSDIHGAGTIGQSLAGAYGHLTLNADGSYSYIADNASAIAAAGTGSHPGDTFTYTTSDGHGGITTATLLFALDRLPVVTAANVTLSAGHASAAASSLFSATDPDGNAIVTYGFMDSGPGTFVLNGVAQSNNQEIDVTAAQLSQLVYQSVAGSLDTLQVRVYDGTLWSGWQSFTVTAPALLIQADTNSFGSVDLTELGNAYYLYNSSGVGPILKVGGTPILAGAAGPGWSPYGAVETATGYDVAWKNTVYDVYTEWQTDSSGNYISDTIGAVTANSQTFEALETTFNQDLNGDGVIGIPAVVIQTDTNSFGSITLLQSGNEYLLHNSGGVGPVLQGGGAPVVVGGEGAGWVPFGAVETATGYDVAWKNTTSGLYMVWQTDSSGNFVANAVNSVSGGNLSLEALETTFNQDLNGDGTIGVVATAIQTDTNAYGSITLLQAGNDYYFHNSSSGAWPVLQSGGTPVVVGGVGAGWVPFGAVETATGFDVAWKNTTSGLYMVWQTDSNGNFVANAVGAVTGSNLTLEGLETTFNQDLNGDGTIGVPTTVIQTDTNAYGSITLLETGNEYYLHNSSGVGPVLQTGGAPVLAGSQGAGWIPFGAVETASGFDVAWKNATSGLYMVWQTDGSGNFVSNAVGAVTGGNLTLQALETTFNQDLNGDGTIGVAATVIQTDTNAYGSITLLESGNEYYLHNSSGAGPVLQVGGVPIMDGAAGPGWSPYGAVETATGYDVAWKNTVYGVYTEWQTDSNGNYVSDTIGAVTSTSPTLEALETTFNQDLNGDGTIGPPGTTVIQTDTNAYGSITLLEFGNDYLLHNSSGIGPTLELGGIPVVVGGEGAGWIPFGAVETASGFDVAWKNTVSGLYMVWQTDSNGNFVADAVSAAPGSNLTLEGLETTFDQDLNGDGTIGVPATVIQTDTNLYGSITLLESGNEYYLHNSSGAGPVLQSGGTPVTDGGEGAGWEPFGAVETATGYDVAWKNTVSGLYMVWQTDSSGNFVANAIGAVAGSNLTLEGLETTFNQDLNGDGTIGVPSIVIQTDTNSYGSTTLVESGNEYYLHNNSGIGPVLEVFGSPIMVGGAGPGWAPIGAAETATGYDVAWQNTVYGVYTVWQTDSSGNYVSDTLGAVTSSNSTLEALETTFNQDLNGDGTIGVPAGGSAVSSLSHATGTEAITISVGATVEVAADHAGSVTFEGSTGMLRLDDAPAFSSEIFNFSGDGTLSGSDQIDLRDINFNSVHDSYDNGVLTVSDGADTATLDFNGSYVLANFSFANDGSGGTIVYDPPVSNANTSPAPVGQTGGKGGEQAGALVVSSHDNFVFPSHLGSGPATDHVHDTNAAPLSQSELAHVTAIIAAIHDDSHAGSAPDMMASAHSAVDHFHGDFFVK